MAEGVPEVVRVGGGQGFWGDDLDAPIRQIEGGPLDYLILDYLAEVTMSVLRKLRNRDPSMGYAHDFVTLMERIFPACVERGVRVLANAGGVHPEACACAVVDAGRRAGVAGRAKVALVRGDDLMERLDELIAAGHTLAHMESGEPLANVLHRVRSANAYIGAAPLVRALDAGADIVITGRCADPALAYAPLIHAFRWDLGDHDRLAAGAVGGHLIECGAQASGGNSMVDWWTIPDLDRVGFPVLEVAASGEMVVTKHPGTGGRVDRATVTEQLVYEIGDPKRFLTPDVTADFTTIRLEDLGGDRVAVRGVRGARPTDHLKVSIAYSAGWTAAGTLLYTWPDAMAKARAAEVQLRSRFRRLGLRFDEIHSCAWPSARRTGPRSSGSPGRWHRSCSTGRRRSRGTRGGARACAR